MKEKDANEAPVLVRDIAQELGVDASYFRRWLIDNGFSFIKVRGNQNQRANALTAGDAARAVALREEQGYPAGGIGTAEVGSTASLGLGWFYVIQLVPELEPNRVKLGYADTIRTRLAAHKTTCPNARLAGSWRCKPAWELAARESATREGCQCAGGEVFDVDDITSLLERCAAFFELMPTLEPEVQ
jgi:hypothetical protein